MCCCGTPARRVRIYAGMLKCWLCTAWAGVLPKVFAHSASTTLRQQPLVALAVPACFFRTHAYCCSGKPCYTCCLLRHTHCAICFVSWLAMRAACNACGGLRAQSDYERIASFFGILSDWKDGVPRASYRGVVRLPPFLDATASQRTGSFLLLPALSYVALLLSVPWPHIRLSHVLRYSHAGSVEAPGSIYLCCVSLLTVHLL